MKFATLILGILGGLAAGFLGVKWIGDLAQLNELQVAMAQSMGTDIGGMRVAALLLLAGSVAGIVGGVLAFRGKFLVGGVIMLAAGVLPVMFASQAIIFTLLLMIGGVVALVAHWKTGAQRTATA